MNKMDQRSQSNLIICYWNACAVTNKKHELMNFLVEENIDIMLLGETWLKNGNNFSIPNYTTYRTDRTAQPHGGTAILIKKHIKHTLQDSKDSQIENTCIEIQSTSGPILIIAAYCSPKKKITKADLNAFFSTNRKILLMGDLNAKNTQWDCNSTNISGKSILRYFERNDIQLHIPNSPTHYSAIGRPEILDIVISKNIYQDLDLEVLQDLSSDHNPIKISLLGNHQIKPLSTKSFTVWNRYTYYLKNKMENIKTLRTTEDIDEEVKLLTQEIKQAVENCTKVISSKANEIILLPTELRQLIKDKRKAQKKAQRTRHPNDILAATRLNNNVRSQLQTFHNNRWNNKVESLNSDRFSLWKLIKSLKTKRSSIPPLQGTYGIGYTNNEKAEILATSIENQCTPNEVDDENEAAEELEEEALSSVNQIDESAATPITTATLQELENIIKKLKNKKAPGEDTITNTAIKHLPKKAKVKLLNIINASLRLNYFPADWKKAHIITIPKPGKDHKRPENHRPISLLSSFSKLFERIILTRLLKQVEEMNLLPAEQFGFRQNHSTNLQTLRLVETIHKGFEFKDITAIAYLDVAKAFDKVWHDGLIHKLSVAGIPTNLIKIIRSFLQNRSFAVKVEDKISTSRPILAGVPQGSVLGPILYNLYTHDIPTNDYSQKALFADDTAVITQSRSPKLAVSRLQKSLNEVVDWMVIWRIAINKEKTQAVYHTKKRKPPPDKIDVVDKSIPWSSDAKYLGLHIDRKLTWNKHTNEIKKTGLTAISKLWSLLSSNFLNLESKRIIYISVIRPALTYAIATWGHAADVHINKIQVIQNKILRIITQAPWFVSNQQLHRDLQIPSIRKFTKEIAKKLFLQVENHENILLQNILNYNPKDCRPRARRPRTVEILDVGLY